MRTECFTIHLTFGENNVDNLINNYVETKKLGYVCIVDFNVLTQSFRCDEYNKILNNASFNTCDGSSLAFLYNIKNKTNYHSYNGPEIFEKFIENDKIIQLIVGADPKDFDLLKDRLAVSSHLMNLPLPTLNVDQFDYDCISKQINILKPKIIWILLGAPKQEKFISKIIPMVETGLFFGAGAALNFYLGRIKNTSFSILGLRFIWLNRLIKEPIKQSKRIIRFLITLPKIIRHA